MCIFGRKVRQTDASKLTCDATWEEGHEESRIFTFHDLHRAITSIRLDLSLNTDRDSHLNVPLLQRSAHWETDGLRRRSL